MKEHKKKMIAPIVVTIIMIAYYLIYFGILIVELNGALKWILGIVPIAFSVVIIKVCVERINEIRGGEEDDISKY